MIFEFILGACVSFSVGLGIYTLPAIRGKDTSWERVWPLHALFPFKYADLNELMWGDGEAWSNTPKAVTMRGVALLHTPCNKSNVLKGNAVMKLRRGYHRCFGCCKRIRSSEIAAMRLMR